MSIITNSSLDNSGFVYSSVNTNEQQHYTSIPTDVNMKYEIARVRIALDMLSPFNTFNRPRTNESADTQYDDAVTSELNQIVLQELDLENYEFPAQGSDIFFDRQTANNFYSLNISESYEQLIPQQDTTNFIASSSEYFETLPSQPESPTQLRDTEILSTLSLPLESKTNLNIKPRTFNETESYGELPGFPQIGYESRISINDIVPHKPVSRKYSTFQLRTENDGDQQIDNQDCDIYSDNESLYSVASAVECTHSNHSDLNNAKNIKVYSEECRLLESSMEEENNTIAVEYIDYFNKEKNSNENTLEGEDESLGNNSCGYDQTDGDNGDSFYEQEDEEEKKMGDIGDYSLQQDADTLSIISNQSSVESFFDDQDDLGYMSSDSTRPYQVSENLNTTNTNHQSILLRSNLYPFPYLNNSLSFQLPKTYYGPPVAPIHYHMCDNKIYFQDLGCLLLGFNQFGRPIAGLKDSEYIAASTVYAFATMLYECINSPYHDSIMRKIKAGLMSPYEFVCVLGRHDIFQDYLRCVQWSELDRIFPIHQYRFVLSTFYHYDTYENSVSMQSLELFLSKN